MSSYTNIHDEVSKLGDGESLVAIQEEGNGYFIHIGDNTCGNTWAVTKPEMLKLRELLNKKFTSEYP